MWYPRFQDRDLHPTDEDLSVGAPDLGHPDLLVSLDLVLRFLGYWLTPLARKPPSTTKIWPVTNEALSEAR